MIRDKILSKLDEKLDFKSLHSGMINAASGPAKSKYGLDDHKRNWQEIKTKKEYDSLVKYHKNQAGNHTGQGSSSESWLTKDGHKIQSSHHAPFPSVHKLTTKTGETQYFIDTPKRTREKFESGQKKTVKEEVELVNEMALTTASVNKYLKSKGVDDKLYRGKGYYYFDGDDVGNWPETSVYVNHISSIPTVEGWYHEWQRLSSKSYKGNTEPLERNKDGKLVIRLGKRR